MNLVEYIKDQLPAGLSDPLASLLGVSEGAARSAIGAAVPALLSALSGMVSTGSGTQKLASALGQFGGVSMDNLADKLANNPGSLLEQGTGLLNSLLGGSALSAIVSALSRFANIAPGPMQKLLGYLAPMILSAIAARFAGKSVTTQALSSLFAEQKSNIANALPAGLSLGDVPGLAGAGQAARSAAKTVESAAPPVMRWLLPLVVLGILGLLLWSFLPSTTKEAPVVTTEPRTEPAPATVKAPIVEAPKVPVVEAPKVPAPEVTQLSTELTDTFKSLTETLTGVKDVPSAEAALPKLQDLGPKLDAAKAKLDKLTEAGKATIAALVKSSQAKLRELVDKVLAIPGVGDKIKAVVDGIMAKINDLAA
jgi:Bacterial protein of unknown function (DUF937)